MQKMVTEIVGGEPYDYYPPGEYIVFAKGVCDGRPTFKYTRIEIAGTLTRVGAGESIDAIVKGYRGRVPGEAIEEAIEIAPKLGKGLSGNPRKTVAWSVAQIRSRGDIALRHHWAAWADEIASSLCSSQ